MKKVHLDFVGMKKVHLDFVGSHSTGKTSVMEAIRGLLTDEYLVSAEIIPSASREMFLAGTVKELHSKVTDRDQMLISGLNWARILACPAQVVLSTDLFIRSASYEVMAETSEAIRQLHMEVVGYIKRMVFDETRVLKFFYIPPEIPDVPAGVRPSDESWRGIHDPIIHNLFIDHVPNYMTLRGSVNRRAEDVLSVMEIDQLI